MLHHKVHQKHASNQLPPCPQQTVSKVDKQLGNMPAQAALSTTVSTMLHKGVRLSHETKELSFRSVNMVHVKRPHVAVHEQPSRLLAKPTLQAVLDVQEPQAGISKLLSSVRSPSLQQQLQADLNQAVQLFSSTLQLDHLHAKLEVITKQSCPKWHADFVQMRMLCTYAGPGTWCIENSYVEREVNASGSVFVAAVEEAHGIQTGPGDLLFLKGQSYPGLYGAGAVHKSPELRWGEARLVLTVDHACCRQ